MTKRIAKKIIRRNDHAAVHWGMNDRMDRVVGLPGHTIGQFITAGRVWGRSLRRWGMKGKWSPVPRRRRH